jgi:hypothetical protein
MIGPYYVIDGKAVEYSSKKKACKRESATEKEVFIQHYHRQPTPLHFIPIEPHYIEYANTIRNRFDRFLTRMDFLWEEHPDRIKDEIINWLPKANEVAGEYFQTLYGIFEDYMKTHPYFPTSVKNDIYSEIMRLVHICSPPFEW